jgi:hypothetical protein
MLALRGYWLSEGKALREPVISFGNKREFRLRKPASHADEDAPGTRLWRSTRAGVRIWKTRQ